MSRISAVIAVVASLGMSQILGAEPADDRLATWDNAQVEKRGALLAQWISEIEQARTRNKAWKPGPELCQLAERLARVPTDNPDLCQRAARFYATLGDASTSSHAFCESWIQIRGGDVESRCWEFLQLVEHIYPHCVEGRDLALLAAKTSPRPGQAYGYLAKHYPEDPKVVSAVITDISGDDCLRSEAAVEVIRKVAIGKAGGLAVAKKFIAWAKAPAQSDGLGLFAGQFLLALQSTPGNYRKVLPKEDVEALQHIASSKKELRTVAVAAILVMAEEIPDSFGNLLFTFAMEEPRAEDRVLPVAMGFLPSGRIVADDRDRYLKAAPELPSEALAGLFSMLSRSEGKVDFGSVEFDWGALYGRVHPSYRKMLSGALVARTVRPEMWRKEWGVAAEGDTPQRWRQASKRHSIIGSLASYPDAADANWVLERSLEQQDYSIAALNTLWQMRGAVRRLRMSDAVNSWLKKQLVNESNRVKAMTVLLYSCSDTAARKALLSDVSEEELYALGVLGAELLIVADPKDKRIAKVSRSLRERAIGPGSAKLWEAWLLDVIQGGAVGEPPLESLAACLRCNEDRWMPLMLAAVEQLEPHLGQLRNPELFVTGSGASPSALLGFLGVLDRLELQRRKGDVSTLNR